MEYKLNETEGHWIGKDGTIHIFPTQLGHYIWRCNVNEGNVVLILGEGVTKEIALENAQKIMKKIIDLAPILLSASFDEPKKKDLETRQNLAKEEFKETAEKQRVKDEDLAIRERRELELAYELARKYEIKGKMLYQLIDMPLE